MASYVDKGITILDTVEIILYKDLNTSWDSKSQIENLSEYTDFTYRLNQDFTIDADNKIINIKIENTNTVDYQYKELILINRLDAIIGYIVVDNEVFGARKLDINLKWIPLKSGDLDFKVKIKYLADLSIEVTDPTKIESYYLHNSDFTRERYSQLGTRLFIKPYISIPNSHKLVFIYNKLNGYYIGIQSTSTYEISKYFINIYNHTIYGKDKVVTILGYDNEVIEGNLAGEILSPSNKSNLIYLTGNNKYEEISNFKKLNSLVIQSIYSELPDQVINKSLNKFITFSQEPEELYIIENLYYLSVVDIEGIKKLINLNTGGVLSDNYTYFNYLGNSKILVPDSDRYKVINLTYTSIEYDTQNRALLNNKLISLTDTIWI